ncbi:MAG: HAD family acid phosphatase [Gemmataceae bacterium]
MTRCWPILLLAVVAAWGLGQAGSADEGSKPPELFEIKKQLRAYYTGGDYQTAFTKVVEEAKTYLQERGPAKDKQAVVFDIDETTLSNAPYIEGVLLADVTQFTMPTTSSRPFQMKAEDKALPTLELYKLARKLGYRTYFITGRGDTKELRAATEKNLRDVGYAGYEKLYMRPTDYKEDTVVPYKSGRREEIEKSGAKIVLNIGDQWSDLKGGFAEKTFKLPNPFYFIP